MGEAGGYPHDIRVERSALTGDYVAYVVDGMTLAVGDEATCAAAAESYRSGHAAGGAPEARP